MITHSSLSAPFIVPGKLNPSPKMERNEPCWCLSGKKWKRCHKDRERREPVNSFEMMASMRAEALKGYCSHPDAAPATCGDHIVRAHTVQRAIGLAAIAECGHVLSPKAGAENLFQTQGLIIPAKIGVNHASTFMGFCDFHDSHMFRPAEHGTILMNPEVAFLLSFRALAYELFAKRTALRIVDIERMMDMGKPYAFQCFIQEHLYYYTEGLKLGIADLEKWKAFYDDAFRAERFDAFRAYGAVFSDILPIAGCGAFYPEFDFNGTPLQIISRGPRLHEHVVYNITTLGNRTAVVLGSIETTDGPARAFVESFAKLPNSEKANASIRLAFEHLENIYITPSWWERLSVPSQQAAMERFHSGLGWGNPERKPNCLLTDGHVYAESEVVEEITIPT